MRLSKLKKIEILNGYLDTLYDDPRCELTFESAFQLLVATILSAQCTDKQVNKTTPALFQKYSTAEKMAKADLISIEQLIHSTGFYKNKAKNILMASKAIVANHNGEVPSTLQELIKLSGVGRKTANVVLGNAYNVPGIVVDTHMLRVTERLGLTKNNDPVKVEQDIMKIVNKDRWTRFSHQVVLFGRYFCIARVPKCGECLLRGTVCGYKREVGK